VPWLLSTRPAEHCTPLCGHGTHLRSAEFTGSASPFMVLVLSAGEKNDCLHTHSSRPLSASELSGQLLTNNR
jgi:hypothetical protein